jgi:hypothetical protein
MMMASDSTDTPPSRLDDATVDVLRSALRVYLGNRSLPGDIQSALTRLGTEAREKDILPEHLLIVLKGVWNALPEVRGMTDSGEQIRLLQRVVTMCIEEYYKA